MNDERYAVSRAAQKSGGPCPICGWRDGDGQRVCFYSAELGQVVHEEREETVVALMTDRQRTLYLCRQEFLFISPAAREAALIAAGHSMRAARARWELNPVRDAQGNPVPFRTALDGSAASDADALAHLRKQYETQLTADDPRFAGWIREPQGPWKERAEVGEDALRIAGRDICCWTSPSSVLYVSFRLALYEPHFDCGGRKIHLGPYHYACSSCDTEIRLWELGVDYDVG